MVYKWYEVDCTTDSKGMEIVIVARVSLDEYRCSCVEQVRRVRYYFARSCAGKLVVFERVNTMFDTDDRVLQLGIPLDERSVIYGRAFKNKKRLSAGGQTQRR